MSIVGGLSRYAESYGYIHHRRLGLSWVQGVRNVPLGGKQSGSIEIPTFDSAKLKNLVDKMK
jgi:hypothetical protein